MTDTARPSYPRPVIRSWLGRCVVASGALWLYGLDWDRPALPSFLTLMFGIVGTVCAVGLWALTPAGTAAHKMTTLDPERQKKLRAINRRSYAPIGALGLSVICLGLISGARGVLQPVWYEITVVVAAAVLLVAGWHLFSLRSAERRLYDEVRSPHAG